MATAVVDTQYLSGYLDVPEPTLNTLLDTPTAELVQAILEAVAVKAHEHDELVADKLRLDIELENAVRSSETRVEGLRSSVEKAQKTVEEVRTKLKEEENARSSLESELETLRSSSTTSTSEVETLRTRIASLESANRDTIAVLESKTTANDSLSQDLQKQHQKGLELSQQITNLQQSVQNANSAASSAKFREQSLKQEVELAKRNNEWFENELKTKSAEALKYRKEKGARIAELQRLNEEANSNLEALRRTEQALRSRLDEVQKKAEDSLLKVQQLQESAAKTEEGFRQELESARRLAELQSQQTETHRNRLQEVEAGLEKAKDDAAEEVGRCRQEAEAERQDREHAEHRIAELEAEIDRLEALTTAPNFAGSVPGTPRQGLNGSVLGRPGSPFGTPGSVRSKSAITATQAIEELYKVKGQLATEKRHSAKLEAEIDEMMQGLEAKVPEHEELQAELQRLQQEVVEMSKFVDQTGKERDRAKKDARKAESQASTAQAEANILRQQLRDLSAQIKMLLCDLDARERGLAALSASERSQLERLARGEVSEEALEGMTDTDKFISQRLTVFRNISELQEKNQELLKITRQLGAQMESEEAISAKHQAAKDHEEVQNLLSRIEGYKDELQSMVVRSESYIKERDMFRRMLQHRGPIPPGSELASLFAQSVDGSQNGVMHSTEQNSQSRDNTNYATLLRELQGHFDQYREEQSTDRRTMKEQTEKLSMEKGSLQAEISKISSQLTFANERYEMLHSNYTMLQNENTELQKRSQVLSEAAAKQDLRTQQVAEDLIEAKGLVESMRNENANLKAEKKLWKDIQDRLSQDNESLMNERSRLNGLIANQQTLQNERELSESETRRRLQTQVESLETELSTTKRKLSDEVEDNKKAQLRKEYDSQQTQKRIDDLVNSLGSVREELVAAKTTRDHLQARVDELTIELKSAEERVEVLQPRPTPRPGTNGNANPDHAADTMQEDTLTKEQELSIEVSELKRDLELTKSDLENTKSQMEQYRSISQSSEEELQSLNETQDQYREEMDRLIEEKDSKIRELQQRVDDISTELATTNNEMTTLRNQQADVARQAEEEKAALEVEISRLKDEDERHATAAQFHQQDLRAQAAIATKAQQDYENELVKHAEAAKILQNLRTEYNQLKTEAVTLRAEAESAKVTLSQSEASWEERREHFEQELKELKTRRDDVNTQNKLLHEQLDGLSSQILALQQSRSTLSESAEAGSSGTESTDRAAEGLRELNTFLRREKEILEVQYELKVQEAKRLQQQLGYAQSQLDESRLKLDQERRANADGSRSSIAHKDLMEKLTELNLFRESSITLRNEARQAQTHLAEKTKRVEELVEQIQPLENRIRELEHSKETSEGEMRLLQEDRDRWQKRTQDILSKYDRIDPAEMEQLKETLESLRTEKDALLEAQQPMQEKLQALEGEKVGWEERRQKLIEQFKDRSRNLTKDKNDRVAERDAALKEKDTLREQLTGLQQQLETAVQEKNAAQQQLSVIQQELDSVKIERDQAISNASQTTPAPAVAPQTSEQDQQLNELRQQLENITREKQALEEQLTNMRQQLEQANSERDAAIADAAAARSTQTARAPEGVVDSGVEDGQIDETPKQGISDAEKKALEDRIATAEAKAKEQEDKAAQLEGNIESVLKQRSDKMKTLLNNKLVESRAAAKAQLEAEYALKLEQEKQIWLAEYKAAAPDAVAPAPVPDTKDVDTALTATPTTPGQKDPATVSFDGNTMTDQQVREFLSTNPVVKGILAANIKKKVETETQKIKQEQERIVAEAQLKAEAATQKAKQEQERVLAEAQQKADGAKAQAVLMEGKKSALKINMEQNKSRNALAKIEVVEKAAQETPEKPVAEVWEIAKVAKPPQPPQPPAPTPTPPAAAAEPAVQLNGAPTAIPKVEPKVEVPRSAIPQPQSMQQSKIPAAANGTSLPVSSIPPAPTQPGNNPRPSGLPQRGGAAGNRGRGNSGIYQPNRGGGGQGRGRGGGVSSPGRGGMNPGAQNFNPQGPAGMKRPREEGSIGGAQQGNGGKRARGGGQN